MVVEVIGAKYASGGIAIRWGADRCHLGAFNGRPHEELEKGSGGGWTRVRTDGTRRRGRSRFRLNHCSATFEGLRQQVFGMECAVVAIRTFDTRSGQPTLC